MLRRDPRGSEVQTLRTINLGMTQVKGPGLAKLAALPDLVTLTLSGLPIDDSVMKDLAAMSHLDMLVLDDTKITGSGFAKLAALKELTNLMVHYTGVTDANIVELAGVTSLKELSAQETNVTMAGAKKLKEALPNCKIDFGPLLSPTRL